MEDQVTKILDIQVNYEKAINGVAEYEKAIREAKEEQVKIKEALKDGTITQEQYDKQMTATKIQIKQLKTEQAALVKQVQQNVKAENAEQDSLVQLRARLSNLTAEYDAMSKAERESAKGTDLQKKILEVTAQLKDAEFATERFYRNVGNYEKSSEDAMASLRQRLEETKQKYKELVATEGEASKAAQDLKKEIEQQEVVIDATGQYVMKLQSSIIPFGDKIIPLLGKGLKGVKEAFVLAGQGAKILGKELLALMANPIVAFLGILAAAIATVVSGIKNSEENMNKWRIIMAPLQRGLAAIQSVIQTLCGWILNFVAGAEGLLLILFKIGEALPLVGGAFAKVNEAVAESIALEKEKISIEKQERENTVQNAKDALEVAKLRAEANDKENKTAKERLEANQKAQKLLEAQADREVEIAERKLKALQIESQWADNDADTNNRLAEAEAAVYAAREKQYTQSLRLQQQENSLRSEIQAEQKARADAAKKAAEDRARALEEQAKAERDAIRASEDAIIAIIKDSVEQRRQQLQLQYSREIEDLKARLETEKNLTDAAREAINQTIIAKQERLNQELEAISIEETEKEMERQRTLIELRLSAAEKGTEEEYELKKQQMEMQMNDELAMYENDQEMQLAIRAKYNQMKMQLDDEREQAYKQVLQKEIDDAKAAADKIRKIENDKAKGVADSMGSIGDAIESLSGENKKAVAASKVLALAEVAIKQGVAISEAIANATQGDPYTMAARIAAAVASVISGMVAAVSSIEEAHFAQGGKVRGAGTGTSDSIPARLSNGEFVATAAATSLFEPLLLAMNAIGRGVVPQSSQSVSLSGASSDLLTNSIAASIENIQPVVSVVDINRGQQRVSVIDNLDTL